jgi:hypothetical protein
MSSKPTRPRPVWRGRLLWIAVGLMLAITAFWGDALSAPPSHAEQKKDLVEYLKSI